MAHQRRNRKKKQRTRGRFGAVRAALSCAAIVVLVLAACVVFFRVDDVEVVGVSRYEPADVVAAAGIEKGDNLFLLNRGAVSQRVLRGLPYIQSVTVRRVLPDGVLITVTESPAAAAVASDNGWWLISAQGKILELAEDPGTAARVTGLTLLAPSAGTQIAVGEEQRLRGEALLGLLDQLDGRGMMADVQAIDLSSDSEAVLTYQERLRVKIPLAADFAYKVKFLEGVVDQLQETDKGTLDMTMDDKIYFTPD